MFEYCDQLRRQKRLSHARAVLPARMLCADLIQNSDAHGPMFVVVVGRWVGAERRSDVRAGGCLPENRKEQHCAQCGNVQIDAITITPLCQACDLDLSKWKSV